MKSFAPCREYVHHFIIVINQKGQESICLAKTEQGKIQVERRKTRRLVDAKRQVTLTAVFLRNKPSC